MQSFFDTTGNLLPFDGEAYLYPEFFSKQESDFFYKELMSLVNWKQEPIRIYGKEIMQPRLTAFYGITGIPYSYSGITLEPQQWNDVLLAIKMKIEARAGVEFTSALLNQYRSGQDSMGWHRDNEKALGINPVIGSVSLGATRKFQLRHYRDKKIVRSLDLDHGSFLLMQGTTQHNWEHQVPKTASNPGKRINITFRILPQDK